MTVNVRWREVNQGMQLDSPTRDVAPESFADARDGAVGALVEFGASALNSHSMKVRIREELGRLSWVAHGRLRNEALRTQRNNNGCLAVVIVSVTEMWFTGQTSTLFMDCSLWGNIWQEPRAAISDHDRTPRMERRFGQNENEYRYFWATIS